METTPRPELTPIFDRFKNPKKADAGATHQGNPIAMKECSHCRGRVVWVKSTKTGKFYLADCYRYAGDGDNWYYMKSSPHFKNCQQRKNANDTIARDLERQAAVRQLYATLDPTDPNNFDKLMAGLDIIDQQHPNH